MNDNQAAFQRLSDILDTLRTQCPWDRAQTLKSLRYLTIEEVHELSEAIVAIEDAKSSANPTVAASPSLDSDLKKELGDLAMHILFYCKIAEDEGRFTIADVYNAVCDKLVERHPFIYRRDEYHGESWEQLKMREGRRNVLEGVPDSLPALVKAVRMQEKVAGMQSGSPQGPLADSVADGHLLPQPAQWTLPDTEDAFGDLLFALVDWARRHGINADDALAAANLRFRHRHSNPEQ